MLTYSFSQKGSLPMYDYLYRCIKNDILSNNLKSNEKLPSKRTLAKNLNISVITVENAYAQLLVEGYIYSIEKKGYYVSDIYKVNTDIISPNNKTAEEKKENLSINYFADFQTNTISHENFPFTSWSKTIRSILSKKRESLLNTSPINGVSELRNEIARHLYHFRGMNISPEHIIIGAGTEYLYGLLIQLLGRENIFAVEDPGYSKISKIYQSNLVKCRFIELDKNGLSLSALKKSDANIIHISPSHHFPTGIVTPVKRRQELLKWAMISNRRYIIEDDYDCEFRFSGKPIPTIKSIDTDEKVIYINTFSKTLAPSFRISYMALPHRLMEKFNSELGFYSCTVSAIEQYTLAEFISSGFFEKHINRMRTFYRGVRNQIINEIKASSNYKKVKIEEENSGLHFLLNVKTKLTDKELIEKTKKKGIKISCLSKYYVKKENCRQRTLIVNYSGISKNKASEAAKRLMDCLD